MIAPLLLACTLPLAAPAQAAPAQAAPAQAEPAQAAPTPQISALRRVAIIGGSISSGLGLEQELIAHVNWKHLLEATVATRNCSIIMHADENLDAGAVQRGGKQVDAARSDSPTLVIALDFLFWFGYGAFPTRTARLDCLANGLDLLAQFDCPVVIGDVPWFERGTRGVGRFSRPTFRVSELPTPAALDEMNAMIRAWAQERPNVTLISLSDLYAQLETPDVIKVRDTTWDPGSFEELLQADFVHPNANGSYMLILTVADHIARAGIAPPERFHWDLNEIEARLMKATEVERATRLERQRKRAEREAKRAEKGLEGPAGKKRRKREQGDG